MGATKDVLAYTNPLAYPLFVGMLMAVVLKNVCKGLFKDAEKVFNRL